MYHWTTRNYLRTKMRMRGYLIFKSKQKWEVLTSQKFRSPLKAEFGESWVQSCLLPWLTSLEVKSSNATVRRLPNKHPLLWRESELESLGFLQPQECFPACWAGIRRPHSSGRRCCYCLKDRENEGEAKIVLYFLRCLILCVSFIGPQGASVFH